MRSFQKLVRDRRAATAIEYAMIIAVIALVAVVAIRSVATGTTGLWNVTSQNVADHT
jgi:pilus assembly protein Flp/PilA